MFTATSAAPAVTISESAQNISPSSVSPVHAVGAVVIHPSEGICEIERIEKRSFNASTVAYYVLKPKFGKSSSTVYLPIDRGNTLLRSLLLKSEIDQIITDSTTCPSLWVNDNKKRKKAFNDLLSEGDYAKLIRMIRDIHDHTRERIADGKKPCAADEAILEAAERLMHQEFAYVLHLPLEEIGEYIARRISDADVTA